MTVRCEHTVDVATDPARTFAFLDDVAQTPRWLARCTGVEKLTPGPNAVGTQLRCSYEVGPRRGTVTGEITARLPGERLTCGYTDERMVVVVDFRIAPATRGTRLTHSVEVTLKTLPGKLLSPVIRRVLASQIVTAMDKLRDLLAAR